MFPDCRNGKIAVTFAYEDSGQKHVDPKVIGVNAFLTREILVNRIAQVQINHAKKKVSKKFPWRFLSCPDHIHEPTINSLSILKYFLRLGGIFFGVQILAETLTINGDPQHFFPIAAPNPRFTIAIQLVVRKVF
jgi:hypothetical protein